MKKMVFINLFMAIFMITILSLNSQIPANATPTAQAPDATSTSASESDCFVSPSGSDRNSGTEKKPWKTIQKAANAAAPGSTVYIKAGTYYERINMNVSGTKNGGAITFRNYKDDKVIIDGSKSSASKQEDMIHINDKDYIKLIGLEISNNVNKNTDYFITGIGIWGKGEGIEIRDCKIHHIWYTNASDESGAIGIAVYGMNGKEPIKGLIIDGNEIWDMKCGNSETVALNGNVDGFQFTNNYVHDSNNIGIDMIGDETFGDDLVCPVAANNKARNGFVGYNKIGNISCETNPCYQKDDYSASGIYADGGKDIVIAYNTCFGNDIGIAVENEKHNKNCSGIVVRDNLIYGNSSCGIEVGGYDEERGWASNCKFLNNTLYNNDTKKLGRGEICIAKCHDIAFQNNIVYTGAQNLAVNTEEFGKKYTYNIALNNNIYYGPGGARGLRFRGVDTGLVGLNMWRKKTGQDMDSRIADPLFADVNKNDYHLMMGSPAVNFGNPAFTSAKEEKDFGGGTRVVDNLVDCGAFEFKK